MSECWKDIKYLCYERKVDSVKRNGKEIRVEANQKLLMRKLKMQKKFMRKEKTPQK